MLVIVADNSLKPSLAYWYDCSQARASFCGGENASAVAAVAADDEEAGEAGERENLCDGRELARTTGITGIASIDSLTNL